MNNCKPTFAPPVDKVKRESKEGSDEEKKKKRENVYKNVHMG